MRIRKRNALLPMSCVLLISACATEPVPPGPDVNYLARYDVEVRNKDLKSQFNSQSFLDAEESTTFGAEPNYVELRVRPVSDSEYDVRVTIRPTREATRRAQLTKTFRGQFGVPLEMVADEKQLKVRGTLAIVRSR